MKISVVIPAHNEEGCLHGTVSNLVDTLKQSNIPHEILIVNDNSRDKTLAICQELSQTFTTVRYVNNQPPNGFGFAVRRGLAEFSGDAVAIMMADASDDPKDLVAGYYKLQEGYDCVFGSRFIKKGLVVDYPRHKLLINRWANWFVKTLFGLRYNDVTNAFKIYRSEVIDGVQPILSHHFNLTVELPLKAIVRGYSHTVIPMHWYNRTTGISKLKIKEMGSRYLFIVLYVWLEKHLSRGDYHRSQNLAQLKTDTMFKFPSQSARE
ncbi:MAG TPA: glycosyltransferase family 2 protein [Cyanobacteria bacterium UBA11149]|nr:glycosyltransferase family 2 protein [Cyanobacteria bacterium UBA11367]HBE59795.1 glycosyltransferase family 2 protein [Cyanobacteria bacterium UBA11366]HBK64282.1 glycosyltransferase family 2 protein [Cyanobacteria bacterium UBA11166]HBR72370.1 glycosyltransferase family 2 protein [Cyanobacteria bacterium UBA11159]HBS70845.1 glycosyltransferase family 2 protein [Cyanobacteria bacterium UBA11153]HBW89539.1 glycosyltransferase family 2 protein [Cyanobacteria bacterium UBA11149]HCA94287.1 gl